MQRTATCGDMKLKPARCSITGHHWSPIHPRRSNQPYSETHTDLLHDLLESKKENLYESSLYEEYPSSQPKTEFPLRKSVSSSYKKSTLKPINSFKRVGRKQKVPTQPTVSQSTADNVQNLTDQESEGKTHFETERLGKEWTKIPKRIESFKIFENEIFSPKRGEASPSYLKETSCSDMRRMNPGFVSNSNGRYKEKQAVLTERKAYCRQKRVLILRRKPSLKSFNFPSRTGIDRSDQCSAMKCTPFSKHRKCAEYHLDSEMNVCRYAYCSLHSQNPLMRILSKKAQNRIILLKNKGKNQKKEIEDTSLHGDKDRYKEKSYADEEEVSLDGESYHIKKKIINTDEEKVCISMEGSTRIVHGAIDVIPDGKHEKDEEECPSSSLCQESGRNIDTSNFVKRVSNPEKRNPRLKNSWGRLKQRILLKRFIKEVQNLRGHIFSGNHDSLKQMNANERMREEDWLMDYTLRQIVGKLKPNNRRNVKLLVEAFEALSVHSRVNPPPERTEMSAASDKGEEHISTPPQIIQHVNGEASVKEEISTETGDLKVKRRLWQLLYENAMSKVEEERKTRVKDEKEEETEGGKADSFRLVKAAVDAVLCGGEKEVGKVECEEGEKREERKKRWGRVKKMVLLSRFIKEVERVKGIGGKGRNLEIGERRRGEEWMLDHALQRVVSQLTPLQRKRVTLLVHAFETLKPNQQ